MPLAYPIMSRPCNKRVKGFVPSPLSIVDFRAVKPSATDMLGFLLRRLALRDPDLPRHHAAHLRR